ncbi:chromosome segregation protein SMC [bacterium]|nr:chromosome segregation protein SMC [bacterium]
MANRLSSLDLQGFKTFATTSRLEFPGQITAIVGPNGSGKSNIADSIRWVLGEQSYSLLRAKKTEDMIFSGSQQRPRAGMASATITFNNDEGWLPIDFSEVTVSRRAYRDGQNEYLLNGQKVRLKDITELLAQTGLAEMSYTVIGQGLVDVALALKPDERRKLFEEAAGIGLYRSRKEDALRRLENTRKNLDRVLDIMTEIKPRLRSLERQAARFTEHERLRADLQVLLREWYGYHWHRRQEDLQNARKAYKTQEGQLSTLRRQHADFTKKVEESRLALKEKRKELEISHKTLAEHHQELQQASRELAIIDERRRSFTQQKGNLEIDLANTEEAVKDLQAQEERFRAEIEQRTADFDAANDEVNQVESRMAKVKAQKEQADAQLEKIRQQRVALETQSVQMTARLDELKNRMNSLAAEREKIQTALGELQRQMEQAQANTAELEKSFSAADKRVTLIETELKEKTKELDQQRAEKQKQMEALAALNADFAKRQAQLDVLLQAEAALSGYSEGSKTLLDQSRKGSLPKDIVPLSQHIVVEEQYEKALSAALGELTDVLVIPSTGMDAIVPYLESNEADRVALVLSESNGNGKPSGSLLNREGVIGLASDLVSADDQYQSLVKTLLADIIVVKDRPTALTIQPKLTGLQKVVTLNGLVFQSNGVILSGQGASAKRMGRTRRKGEMETELADLTSQVTNLQNKVSGITNSIEAGQSELQSLNLELETARDERESARRQLQSKRDSLTRVGEQITWHEERQNELEQNEQRTKNNIQQHRDKIDDLANQIDELISEEHVHRESANSVPIFEVQQELNQWQTHLIVTRNALEAAQQRLEDHQKRLTEAQERLTLHRSRHGKLETGLQEIGEQENTLKETVDTISTRIAAIEREQIEPLTQSTQAAEETVTDLQKQEDQSHQNVIIAERQYTQLQLELDRRNDQLQNLVQRIEDDFGLVAYDYEQRMDGPNPLPFDDGTIEDLPVVKEISDELEGDIKYMKSQIRRIGAINPEAQKEYTDVKERFTNMNEQITDLEKASEDLHQVIEELDTIMERDFLKTFKAVNQEFSVYFTQLFNGGEAKLVFSDEENPVEGGVDIEARLPGRRQQGLALLSGGERSLTAVALIFALLKVSPTPFCILDEVDAMLDESNVGRFIDLLRELAEKTQFVIITHNRNTVQAADVIYGVSMGRESVSQMISLKLEEVDEAYLK